MFTHKTRKYPKGLSEQKSWKHFMASFSLPRQSYDVAIGYLEKTSIYCCVDVVDAKRKIGFIRTNYTALKLDKNFDQKYFEKLDVLCANGQQSLNTLHKEFPNFSNKIKWVPNVSFPDSIVYLADEKITDVEKKEGELTVVSIGRLDQAKGYDLSVEACALLLKEKIKVNWYVIGEGPERKVIEDLIQKHGVTEHFHLLGTRVNPYPYLKLADIFVQASRHEGKSNTIEEAKILCKSIVVTNFDAVFEQIEHGFTGFIVEKTPEAIAEAIVNLSTNSKIQLEFKDNLSAIKLETQGIEDFYRILGT
jgi:glycosyltransferase involved in cell wall biosynthesis